MGGHSELRAFLQRLEVERRLSPHTVSAYRRDFTAFSGFCEREQLASFAALDSYHVRRFAAESHRRGLGPRSVARRLSAVRSVPRVSRRDRCCASQRGRARAGAEGAKRLPSDARRGPSREPARDQRRRAVDAARSRDPRALLFVRSAARGARGSRISANRPEDRTVRVLGKGGKTRIVPVGRKASRR